MNDPDMSWTRELKSITLLADDDTPPLYAPGASEEYRAARRALSEAEMALRDHVEQVAALRRALPPGPALPEYRFTEGSPDDVTLAELFGEHRELVVYHLMFHPDDDAACAQCSLWVDGLHGVHKHITRRAALAVVAVAPIEKLRGLAHRRGWHGLRLVSAHGGAFATDLGIQGSRGGLWPAVSVFTRDDAGRVRHTYTQSSDFPDGRERGIDQIAPVWHVFDLLPSGRGDFYPDNSYPLLP